MGSGHSSGSVKDTYEPCRVEPEVRRCKGSINGSFGLCGLNEIEGVVKRIGLSLMVSIKERIGSMVGPLCHDSGYNTQG